MSSLAISSSNQKLLSDKSIYWSVLLIFLFVGLLNTSLIGANWRWDDASILVHVHEYSLLQDFFNAQIWQQLSPSNLTPWLSVSYQVDLALFGLEPGLFYFHQIAAIAATGVAFFILLRLWVRPLFAAFGVVLFLVGTPVLLVAQQLMTRHYVEGMFFCLGALILFILYLRNGSIASLVASMLAYALAVTAKEIYVPLVVLLPFLPERDLKLRCKAFLPHAGVALLYVIWRSSMLSSLVGGYVESSDYFSIAFIADVTASFSRFPALLFGDWWLIASISYLSLLSIYWFYSRTKLLLVILVAVLVLSPLVALVRFPGIAIADRYLLLPWMAFAFSCAYFSSFLFSLEDKRSQMPLRVGVILVGGVILIGSLASAIDTRRDVLASAIEFDTVGEFMWQEDDSVAFLPSDLVLSSLWFVTDLSELKHRLGGSQSAPTAIVDPKFLSAEESRSITRLVEYSAECQCMQDSEQSVGALVTDLAQRERPAAPLDLEYSYQGNVFTWKFGPYEIGAYHIISDTIGVVQVPREGSQRVSLPSNTQFYLRYTSPEGWTSYSELQRVNTNPIHISWSRGAP